MSATVAPGSRAWAVLALLTAAVTLTLDFALLRQDERPLSPDEAWHFTQTLDQHESLFGDRPFEIVGTGHGLYPPQQYLIGAIALEVLPPRGWRIVIAAVDAFFWTVLLAAVWAFARRATGRRASCLAVIFTCTTPLLFTAGRSYFIDFGLAAWITFTLWALLRSESGRPGRGLSIVLAGVLLAALQKWSAPLYLVGPALAAAVCFFRWSRKEKARALLGGALLTVAIGGCWLLLVDPSRFLGFTKELHESAGAIGLPEAADAASFGYYLQRFWAGNPLAPLFSLLLIPALGLGLSYRHTRIASSWLLVWLGAGWLTLSLFGRKDPRYLLPLLPVIGLTLAVGLEALAQRTPRFAAGVGATLMLCCCYQLMATIGLIPEALGGAAFRARLEDSLPAVRFDDAPLDDATWSLRTLEDGIRRQDADVAVLARTRAVHVNAVRLQLREIEASVWQPEGDFEAELARARHCEYLLIKGLPREPYETRSTSDRESVRRSIQWLPFSRPDLYTTRLYQRLPDRSWLTLLERSEAPRSLETLHETSRFDAPGSVLATSNRLVATREGDRLAVRALESPGSVLASWTLEPKPVDVHVREWGVACLSADGRRLVLLDRASGRVVEKELPSPARWLKAGPGWVLTASPAECFLWERSAAEWTVGDLPRPGVGGPPTLTEDGEHALLLRGVQLFTASRASGWREIPSQARYVEGTLLACEIARDGRSAAWISQGRGGPSQWCFTWFDLESHSPLVEWEIQSPLLASVRRLHLAVSSEACAMAVTFEGDRSDVRLFERGDPLPVLHQRQEGSVEGIRLDGRELSVITVEGESVRRWRR